MLVCMHMMSKRMFWNVEDNFNIPRRSTEQIMNINSIVHISTYISIVSVFFVLSRYINTLYTVNK